MAKEREWRFQWPDGTWITWNPVTETWEKERTDPSDERSLDEIFEPPLLPQGLVPTAPPPSEAPGEPVVGPPVADPHDSKAVEASEDADEGARGDEGAGYYTARKRVTRATEEILPPEEPELPRARALPAVMIGAAVGAAGGWALVNFVI
jgi:hypothetical protein